MTVIDAIHDWLFEASQMDWVLRLYIAAAVGQTVFVALWATLPWYRTRVGRALMVKSVALMAVLDWGVINYYWGPFTHQQGIGIALFGLVVVGIYSQLGTLAYEVYRGRRDRA